MCTNAPFVGQTRTKIGETYQPASGNGASFVGQTRTKVGETFQKVGNCYSSYGPSYYGSYGTYGTSYYPSYRTYHRVTHIDDDFASFCGALAVGAVVMGVLALAFATPTVSIGSYHRSFFERFWKCDLEEVCNNYADGSKKCWNEQTNCHWVWR